MLTSSFLFDFLVNMEVSLHSSFCAKSEAWCSIVQWFTAFCGADAFGELMMQWPHYEVTDLISCLVIAATSQEIASTVMIAMPTDCCEDKRLLSISWCSVWWCQPGKSSPSAFVVTLLEF